MKKERSVPQGDGEPVVPSHIFYVKVFEQAGEGDHDWELVIDEKTSAQTKYGAMKGIIDSATAKEMLKNKKEVDAE